VDGGYQARHDGENGGDGDRVGCLRRNLLSDALDAEGEEEFLWNGAGEGDAIYGA
jgi:hypothetical protein